MKKNESVTGQFVTFQSPAEPLLEYKNALLCERLLRVIGFVGRRFDQPARASGATELGIGRALLNYLTVGPLINGMRSLEQLVNRLELTGSTVVSPQAGFKPDEIAMIVHNAQDYGDVLNLWHGLARQNPLLSKLMMDRAAHESDNVIVPLG